MLISACFLTSACGAEGIDAPWSPPPPECKRADDYLADLYGLLDQGKLQFLRGVVSEGLSDEARRDLVSVLLSLVGSFESGALSAIATLPVLEDNDGAGLQVGLGQVLRWTAAGSPGSPYLDAFGMVRGVVATCDGASAFGALRAVAADPDLVDGLFGLLGEDGLATLLSDLSFEGAEGREAVRLLLRNVLVSLSQPTFEITALTELLGLLVDVEDPSTPYPALVAGVERVMGEPVTRAGIQGLVSCMLDVDPAVSVGGLIYDLVTAPAGPEIGRVVDRLSNESAEALDARAVLGTLVDQSLEFLATEPDARRALATLTQELLRDAFVAGVLLDLAELLEAEALAPIVDLFTALGTGACR